MRDGVTVRTERPADLAAIRAVNEAAFPAGAEAGLVDALRAAGAFAEGGSLVAERGDEVVGHLLLSVARLDTGPSVLALAPMAVLPAHQRSGVGSTLVREGLARAARTGHPLVVVAGHPKYYSRFGFRPARERGIEPPFDVPDPAWMIAPLPRYGPAVRGDGGLPAGVRRGRLSHRGGGSRPGPLRLRPHQARRRRDRAQDLGRRARARSDHALSRGRPRGRRGHRGRRAEQRQADAQMTPDWWTD
jgi:putative acetyltransferase